MEDGWGIERGSNGGWRVVTDSERAKPMDHLAVLRREKPKVKRGKHLPHDLEEK